MMNKIQSRYRRNGSFFTGKNAAEKVKGRGQRRKRNEAEVFMGAKKKYTSSSLKRAVEKYFDGITYCDVLKKEDGTPLRNALGKEIKKRFFAVPPQITSLCLFLGIDRSTWQNYCDKEKNPDLAPICENVRLRIEAFLEEELTVRTKGIGGIIFNLQNNYGWRDKKEIEIGKETRESLPTAMTTEEKQKLILDAVKSGMLDNMAEICAGGNNDDDGVDGDG